MSVPARILGRMDSKLPPILRRITAGQAGVVTRQQLLRAGVFRTTIDARVKSGVWQPLHPGVYAVSAGNVPRKADLWAAVLYAGPGAMLSHETAAEILGLSDRSGPLIQLVVPERRRVRPRDGLMIRRSTFDYPCWPPLRGNPPHTFYPETIIDLVAAADNLDDVVAWVSRGIARNVVGEAQLRAAARARSRFRWREQLDDIISQVDDGSHFPLEYRYDRDVERAHGLPAATKQAKFLKSDGTKGFRDRYYEQYGLIVELDGKEFHPEEHRSQDRARDNEAVATAGATLRYGWADVNRTPCETAAQVFRALRKRGYPGSMKPCSAACRAFLAPPSDSTQLN